MVVLRILSVLKIVIVLLWPISVSAAVITGTTDPFTGITGIQVLVMSIISTLSGLTALTIRLDEALRKLKSKSLPRPTLFVASHMLGSWLAGVLAFAIAQHNAFTIWPQLTIIIAASFMGAKFVEKVSEFYAGSKFKLDDSK